jgi:hypothetical protein
LYRVTVVALSGDTGRQSSWASIGVKFWVALTEKY